MLVFTIIYCAVVLFIIGTFGVAVFRSDLPGIEGLRIIFCAIIGIFVVAFIATIITFRCCNLPAKRGR
jgi:hypothetical protein